MKTFLIRYKLLIITLAPLLFFLTFISLLPNPGQEAQPVPTQAPTPAKTLEQIVSENQIINTDIDEDRHEFTNPQEIPGLESQKTLPDESIQYTYSSPVAGRPNLIIISKEGFVDFKRSVIPEDDPLFLNEFIGLYGPARWIFEGSIFYGDNTRTHIYPDYGMALKIDTQTGRILEQHTFIKTTVEEYIRKYGEDIPSIPEP